MKHIIILLLMMITLFASCRENKQTQSNENGVLATDDKEQFINILREYKNPDTNYLEQVKSNSVRLAKSLRNDSEDNIRNSIDDNIIVVDSVINQAIKLINENKLKQLMVLLDGNKANFYSHPSNDILFLMDAFNTMLEVLYFEYLPKEEALEKIITIHEQRRLFCEIVIRFDGDKFRGNEDAYFSVYEEELEGLIISYEAIGNNEKKIELIQQMLILSEKDSMKYNLYEAQLAEAVQKMKEQ